jgi:Na+-transporting methylmalonyl-CoA/oxaloacetate decarboxylase gamma subunit
MVTLALLLSCATGWAAFGEDLEKPKPEFSQIDGDWNAHLIPRGKSTSIDIRFHAEGATLDTVAEPTFTPETEPGVDTKNYRSGFFSLHLTTEPGAEATVSLSSNYFTTATELWGPSAPKSTAWASTGATNTALADRVCLLSLKVRDGGAMDADGSANGRIELILAPRDSFWGYAWGTLFIRFFGIFLVLLILMVGMMLSGKTFEWIEERMQKREPPEEAPKPETAPAVAVIEEPEPVEPGIDPAAVAAIALAFHLKKSPGRRSTLPDDRFSSNWAIFGRGKIMADRMPIFDRIQKK